MPDVETVPPDTTELLTTLTVDPARAEMVAPLLVYVPVNNCSVPPFCARSVPVLRKLPVPSTGSRFKLPPSAAMTPALTILVWLMPMLP